VNIVRVNGNNNAHKVFVYALSTCAWCKKTKKFLEEKGIEYEYVDVDRCDDEDLARVRADIESKGLPMSFPLVMIDDKAFITGFHEDKISEALGV